MYNLLISAGAAVIAFLLLMIPAGLAWWLSLCIALLVFMGSFYLITRIINHRHLSQKEAAAELGLTQPKVSNIMAGRLDGFSLVKLMMLMVKLDRDVEIVIKKKPRTRPRAHLNVVYT